MWRWLIGLALILSALAGIVVGALNPDSVTLELAFVQWTASLGAVVALSTLRRLGGGFSGSSGHTGLTASFASQTIRAIVGGEREPVRCLTHCGWLLRYCRRQRFRAGGLPREPTSGVNVVIAG